MPSQGQTSVGTSSVQVLATSTPVRTGTWIKALAANTNKVYVGYLSGVLTTTGYELTAGQEVFISREEAIDASTIWLIAGAASQGVCWRAV